jgi:hypothetical protein
VAQWHDSKVLVDAITSSGLVHNSICLTRGPTTTWHMYQPQCDTWTNVELHVSIGVRDPLHSNFNTYSIHIVSTDVFPMSLTHAPYTIPLIHSQGKWSRTQSWNLSQPVIRRKKERKEVFGNFGGLEAQLAWCDELPPELTKKYQQDIYRIPLIQRLGFKAHIQGFKLDRGPC